MAEGRVENQEPICNHSSPPSTAESSPDPPSESMEDTMEYRLMMAYATRRIPRQKVVRHKLDKQVSVNGDSNTNGTSASQTPVENGKEEITEEKRKKKKNKKILRFLGRLRCMKPQIEDDEEPQQTLEGQHGLDNRCLGPPVASGASAHDEEEEEEEDDDHEDLVNAVNRLIGISDGIQFGSEIEPDGNDGDDNVEKLIGLLLRENGDRLNEKMKEENITADIFSNYTFFSRVITTLLRRIGFRSSSPNDLGPQASPKAQIAATCEVTSRLSAVDTLPSVRLLQYGARYLQEFYSPWVQLNGGYEAAMESDEEVE
ncbi:uncharacterized protein LOC133424386 [Cololabis saira]|uniref:uncharacterized protein LOC133424386 n=1 Tax=Cololabis saira TaxID=129043 RepID=UPI002AD58831|nr:uncharacterized protein LOC133424386 [Cololabis saira]